MNLSFQISWVSASLALLAILVASYLCLVAYRRKPGKMSALIESIRWVIVLLLAILLLRPEWVVTTPPTGTPVVPVLTDASGSMSTEDVIVSRAGSKQVISRSAFADDLVSGNLSTALTSAGCQLLPMPFSAPADNEESLTDLAAPLQECAESTDRVRAVVLLSDGQHNTDSSPLEAVQLLRKRGVPLIVIPTGSGRALPDLSLDQVHAPGYGIVGEQIRVPFTIKSSLLQDTETTVTLKSEDPEDDTTSQLSIRIPAGGEFSGSILWKLKHEGDNRLHFSLPVHPGELNPQNNEQSFSIAGRQELIHVLVIDSEPRWEYRFIRNALFRDPGVEVNTLLLHPNIESVGQGAGYLDRFPDDLSQLSKYDVVFLGDVGVGPKGLSTEQAELLRGLVANQAAGLILMPGPRGKLPEFTSTALGDLFPVLLDGAHPMGTRDATPVPLTLTPEGRSSLLTMLADSEQENETVWRGLPGFTWYSPVERAKAGTLVLAVHPTARNAYGRIPLLVTQAYGNGKVLFMGTDAAWKWRRGVEDKYHYRFWSQVARWMSYRRNMSPGSRIKVFATPEQPRLGDTINLTAMASDEQGAPLRDGEVLADITSPKGVTKRIALRPLDRTWGSYGGSFKMDTAGSWSISTFCRDAQDQAQVLQFSPPASAREKTGLPVNRSLLQELATITNGKVIDADSLDSILPVLRALPEPPAMERRLRLWCSPWVLATLIALMAAFWILRKASGQF
jgi:hypothetical protein